MNMPYECEVAKLPDGRYRLSLDMYSSTLDNVRVAILEFLEHRDRTHIADCSECKRVITELKCINKTIEDVLGDPYETRQ